MNPLAILSSKAERLGRCQQRRISEWFGQPASLHDSTFVMNDWTLRLREQCSQSSTLDRARSCVLKFSSIRACMRDDIWMLMVANDDFCSWCDLPAHGPAEVDYYKLEHLITRFSLVQQLPIIFKSLEMPLSSREHRRDHLLDAVYRGMPDYRPSALLDRLQA